MPVQLNISREELHDLLWSKPLSFAAAECQVSMPVLRQVCLDHDIPLPWGGFKPTKKLATVKRYRHVQALISL
ncbi:hypothetical protein A0256_14295 [Mucilaginibacter sp. PAMC 26640]|nr:hypothetical protein A0256_14295 [Mucilaginibacter sp. PAMC 26640]